MKERLNNVEFLRFFLIWAVVFYHIVDPVDSVNYFKVYGINDFQKYFLGGGRSVEMFFVMAGFFLFLKPNYEQNTFDFIKKKWIRLAPLIGGDRVI